MAPPWFVGCFVRCPFFGPHDSLHNCQTIGTTAEIKKKSHEYNLCTKIALVEDMRKTALLTAFLLLTISSALQAKQLSALFGYSTFYNPSTNQPYVETYLSFDARTIHFAKVDKKHFQATVEIVMIVRHNDTIAYLKKYELKSPIVADTLTDDFTFMDLRRFNLGNGIYEMELSIKDKASNATPYVLKEPIVVLYDEGKTAMSNIQLMASAKPTEQENALSRNGYDMVPYIDDFVPVEVTTLNPYVELYNIRREVRQNPFLTRCYIEKKETGSRVEGIERTVRHTGIAEDVVPIYCSMDITNLPSGNYNLVVEVCNTENETLLNKRVSFQRSNPAMRHVEKQVTDDMVATSFAALITDETLLNHYLDALYPISSSDEVEAARELIVNGSMGAKQTFLYRFWLSRNELNPASAWEDYLARIRYVDANFDYPRTPGIHTDRGRVFLQYGPPDFIRDEKNFVGILHMVPKTVGSSGIDDLQQAYVANSIVSDGSQGQVHYLPYQLWRYNQLDYDVPNRCFLFWDEFRSGFYKLLNSNARGEVRTAFWERVLSQNQLDEEQKGEVGEQFERGF